MSKISIPRASFAALHQKIVERCLSELDEATGIVFLESPDWKFYGIKYTEMEGPSINRILHNSLGEGGVGRDLWDAKKLYDAEHLFIEKLSAKQVSKFFRFIEPDTLGFNNQMNRLEEIAKAYSATDEQFPPTYLRSPPTQDSSDSSNSIPMHEPERLESYFPNKPELISRLRKILGYSEWYLFTYNFDFDNIVVASLTVEKIDAISSKVSLSNPTRGFSYDGTIQLQFVEHKAILIDLISKGVPDKHIHLKMHMDFHYDEISLSVGKSLGFRKDYSFFSTNAILHKANEKYKISLGYYKKDSTKIHSAIRKYLDPELWGHKTSSRKHFFDLDDLNNFLT